jgi:uncharacterized membrane protein YfcA
MEFVLFNSFSSYLLIGCIIFCSQIIYATLGFGAGMFAISILALLYGQLEMIVPFFTLICFPTEALISWKDRKNIHLKSAWIFLAEIIPALLLGSILLKQAENKVILIILGAVIFLLSLYYLFGDKAYKFQLRSFIWIPFFSLISGILGGLFGMAGPPLIFYYKHKNLSKKEFRVALLSIFVVMTLFRFLFYGFLKLITIPMLTSSLVMLPFALLGLGTGNFLHNHISEKKFSFATSIALAFSGLLIIVKNL